MNPPLGGEGKALFRLAHRANRPQTLNLISELLENSTSFVPMGTTLDRVPEVIIVTPYEREGVNRMHPVAVFKRLSSRRFHEKST